METKVGDRVLSLRLASASPATGQVPLPRVELARAVGMSVTTLQTLEETPQNASKYLARLAHYFGVSALWLETGQGPRYTTKVVGSNEQSGSYAVRLDPAMLAEAELLVGAAEHFGQKKFPLAERARWLARVYEQLVSDGGKLTAEHQAALFDDAKQGVVRGDPENE